MVKKAIYIAFFIYGCLSICKYYNYGEYSLVGGDWPKDTYYYSAIKQAVTDNHFPFFISKHFHSSNYLIGHPEVIISPQLYLLKFVSVERFFWYDTLFCFALGYVGLVKIFMRYSLSPVGCFLLLLLVCFNGYPLAHISGGHSMWIGYYLLPWFLYLLLTLLDGSDSKMLYLHFGVFFLLMFMQGSFHICNHLKNKLINLTH